MNPAEDVRFATDSILASDGPRSTSARRHSIGESQLDEGLPGYADSLCLLIDRTKEIHRKVDVHTLDFATGPRGRRQIQVRSEILASIVHLIETCGAERSSLRGNALLH